LPGTTYLVEIVYPRNRIVIPYDFEALFLLGGFDEEGHELSRHTLEELAALTRLRRVPSHSHDSLDELLAVAQSLPREREGFVVRFKSGLRIKIKGEQYCRIHRLLSNCTPLALWEGMMNAEDMDKIRQELPEETLRDFDTIRRLLNEQLAERVAAIRWAVESAAHLPDKAVGLLIQDPHSNLTELQKKFLFMARKGNFFEHVNAPGEARRKAFMTFRPDRNTLPGYEATDAMNRFWNEST
jgi:RNA ligase